MSPPKLPPQPAYLNYFEQTFAEPKQEVISEPPYVSSDPEEEDFHYRDYL